MPKDGPPQGHERDKSPKTKVMPLAQDREYAEWVKEQKQPSPEDKGEMPPDPSEELENPREHGSREPTEGGKPS